MHHLVPWRLFTSLNEWWWMSQLILGCKEPNHYYYYSQGALCWSLAVSTIGRRFALSQAHLEAIESKVWITLRHSRRCCWRAPWCLSPIVGWVGRKSAWLAPFMENSLAVFFFMELGGQPDVQPCNNWEKYSCVVDCGRLLVDVGGERCCVRSEMEELLSLRLATVSAVNSCSALSPCTMRQVRLAVYVLTECTLAWSQVEGRVTLWRAYPTVLLFLSSPEKSCKKRAIVRKYGRKDNSHQSGSSSCSSKTSTQQNCAETTENQSYSDDRCAIGCQ